MAMFPYAIAQMGSFIPNDEGWNRWAVDENIARKTMENILEQQATANPRFMLRSIN
jgi:hypothetical protein